MPSKRRRESRTHAFIRRAIETSWIELLVLLVLVILIVVLVVMACHKKETPTEKTATNSPTPAKVAKVTDTPVPTDEATPTPVPDTPTPTPSPYPIGLCESNTTDTEVVSVPGDNWKVDYLMLVNWDYRLKYTGDPENLVRIDSILTESWYSIQNPISVAESERNFVIEKEEDKYERGNREVLIHLDEMCKAYHAVTGNGVKVSQTGGYRNYATQDRFWNNRDRSIDPPRTIPGNASEHRTGLGFDIWVLDGEKYDYTWFQAHCQEYGFILRYPGDKSKITGITNEQWHYRYVGVEAATEMKQLGMCLEEYVKYKNGN